MKPTNEDIVRAIKGGCHRLRTIAAHLDVPDRTADAALQKARRAKLVKYDSRDGWKVRPVTVAGRPHLPAIDMAVIHPTMRRLVKRLREHGFNTTDSGDGVTNVKAGMECALPYPHVFIRVPREWIITESHRLKSLLEQAGVDFTPSMLAAGPSIQATYSPVDGVALIELQNVTDEALS